MAASGDWVAIGAYAVQTRSVVTAAAVAARLSTRVVLSWDKGRMTVRGQKIKWMTLARYYRECSGLP